MRGVESFLFFFSYFLPNIDRRLFYVKNLSSLTRVFVRMSRVRFFSFFLLDRSIYEFNVSVSLYGLIIINYITAFTRDWHVQYSLKTNRFSHSLLIFNPTRQYSFHIILFVLNYVF